MYVCRYMKFWAGQTSADRYRKFRNSSVITRNDHRSSNQPYKEMVQKLRFRKCSITHMALSNRSHGILSNETPRSPVLGHLKKHTGFLVSRSMTLPAAPWWAAGVIWWFSLYPKWQRAFYLMNRRHQLFLRATYSTGCRLWSLVQPQ